MHELAGQAVRKSDKVIVVKKPANKAGAMHAAEPVERRALAERNSPSYPEVGTQSPTESEEWLARIRAADWLALTIGTRSVVGRSSKWSVLCV